MNDPIRRTRPERTGVRAPLGELELSVMRHTWECGLGGCLGADVQQALNRERPVALTTILTTLERLRDKGIVRREREGKAYRYWPLLSEQQLQERIVVGVLDRLISQFPQAVASYFAQLGPAGTEADRAKLADLARQVETLAARTAPETEDGDGH